jgi:hypothetical protein
MVGGNLQVIKKEGEKKKEKKKGKASPISLSLYN